MTSFIYVVILVWLSAKSRLKEQCFSNFSFFVVSLLSSLPLAHSALKNQLVVQRLRQLFFMKLFDIDTIDTKSEKMLQRK